MDIPPFQEFMASLDSDTIAGIMKDANNAAKVVEETANISPESIPGLQIQSISFQVSLELLAVYHKWLEQQL